MLTVKLETTHIPAKSPTKQSNQAQTSQTTHKPPTNQPNYPQTSHKHTIMSRKSVFYVNKNFNDSAKYVLSLQVNSKLTCSSDGES